MIIVTSVKILVGTSKVPCLHKNNKQAGKNCQNELLLNSGF